MNHWLKKISLLLSLVALLVSCAQINGDTSLPEKTSSPQPVSNPTAEGTETTPNTSTSTGTSTSTSTSTGTGTSTSTASCTLTAYPTQVSPGEPTYLTLQTGPDVTFALIDSIPVPYLGGTLMRSPTKTATYYGVVLTRSGGVNNPITCGPVTVTVDPSLPIATLTDVQIPPPPSCYLMAPHSVPMGQKFSIELTVAGPMVSATYEGQDIQFIALPSVDLNLTQAGQGDFTVQVAGPGGTSSCSAHVNVGPLDITAKSPSLCKVETIPTYIYPGETSYLRVMTDPANTVTLNGKTVSSPSLSGSPGVGVEYFPVTPSQTTSYFLNVSNTSGTASCGATVYVEPPPQDPCSDTLPYYAAFSKKPVTFISSEADLQAIVPGGNYKLAQDITVSSSFRPILLSNSIFDGQGHTISGFNFVEPRGYEIQGGEVVGFISQSVNSLVKNLTLDQPNVLLQGTFTQMYLNYSDTGGLIGEMLGGRVCNVNVKGGSIVDARIAMSSDASGTFYTYAGIPIGGFAGELMMTQRGNPNSYFLDGKIIQSFSSTTVKGYGFTGGFVGRLELNDYNSLSGAVVQAKRSGVLSGYGAWDGGIAGIGVTIRDSFSEGTVVGGDPSQLPPNLVTFPGGSAIGGIVGQSYFIKNSISTAEVRTFSGAAGGITGNGFAIIHSSSSGNVIAHLDPSSCNAKSGPDGGLAARATIVVDSFATGNVSSCSANVGGLIGSVDGSLMPALVQDSYAWGNVLAAPIGPTPAIGAGLVGSVSQGTIANCYSIGSAVGDSVGGLVGFVDSGSSVTNSYWDTDHSGISNSPAGGTGLTTSLMKTQTSFPGWDFVGVWQILPTTYPTLR